MMDGFNQYEFDKLYEEIRERVRRDQDAFEKRRWEIPSPRTRAWDADCIPPEAPPC